MKTLAFLTLLFAAGCTTTTSPNSTQSGAWKEAYGPVPGAILVLGDSTATLNGATYFLDSSHHSPWELMRYDVPHQEYPVDYYYLVPHPDSLIGTYGVGEDANGNGQFGPVLFTK